MESPVGCFFNLSVINFILWQQELLVNVILHLRPIRSILFLKNLHFPKSWGEFEKNDKISYLYIINMGSKKVVPLNNQIFGEPFCWKTLCKKPYKGIIHKFWGKTTQNVQKCTKMTWMILMYMLQKSSNFRKFLKFVSDSLHSTSNSVRIELILRLSGFPSHVWDIFWEKFK